MYRTTASKPVKNSAAAAIVHQLNMHCRARAACFVHCLVHLFGTQHSAAKHGRMMWDRSPTGPGMMAVLREKDVAYGLVLLWSLTAVYGAQVLSVRHFAHSFILDSQLRPRFAPQIYELLALPVLPADWLQNCLAKG